MNPSTRSQLLLAAIMALALLSYLAIAVNSSHAQGGGIYELEASNLADTMWPTSEPRDMSSEFKLLRSRLQR